ncbi:sensor histidine kinase [Nocardioides sp. Arc9.136]|uniref:sensor histidine kinase n=1 Tax=Nocardioides sp. Arc9.136 TaxID=2996826 RepID=UPI00266520AF|nr:sensor histidine kinase [Nocardioides sp. Arc9.136]WKN50516.1 sensor histidine kinase [Nocardioides sp. Arc9.136]
MGVLRSPVVQFLVLSVVTIVAIVIGTNAIAQHVAEDEAVAEARNTTEVLANSVARAEIAALDDRLFESRPGAIDRFYNFADRVLLVENPRAVRINLWLGDGTLLFANRPDRMQSRYDLGPDRERVLREGGTGYEISDPSDPENLGDDDEDLVRVYTPIKVKGERLLFEVYYSLDRIQDRRQEILKPFRWITIGSLAGLLLIVTPILWLLTRRLTRAGEDRERLLTSAVDASDAERRRIARDLHDGVVQDIAGTTFSLTAVARDADVPAHARRTLATAGDSLRDSLRALRSLLAEIHPPDLHAAGLEPALNDLIAPAATAGIQASVSVDGVDGASDAAVALVWRVAQEAVRNAIRHSRATTIAVTVGSPDGKLQLEVVDDGVGFDPAVSDPDRYGLKGLRSLVKDIGGEIEVLSAPGEGTTVRMEVAQQ